MTTLLLVIATALVVTGAVAAAATVVARARAVSAVASGAVLLMIVDGESLTADPTSQSLATACVPLAVGLLGVVMLGLRPATVLALAGAVVAGPVRQALDDPFHDTGCRVGCDPNPLVLAAHPGLADLAHVTGAAMLLVGLLAPARDRDGRALLTSAVTLVTSAIFLSGNPLAGLAWAAGVAAAVLAADLARTTTVKARLTGAVAALATTNVPDRVLGEALGGRALTVGYPVGGDTLVDRDGKPLPAPPPDWTVVDIAGPDGAVAQLRVDRVQVAPVALARAVQGPVRLALENNRLGAEAAVRSEEIRSSAARLVDLAERGRRRLERDLHDGAQRHVLTLGLAVQSEKRLPEALRRDAALSVRSVLDQLRDVAHGIRPPQLDMGGLARGLAVLADRSAVPLDIGAVPETVTGPAAEAAYRLVEDVMRTAKAPVVVTMKSVAAGGWSLVVEVTAGGELAPRASDRFRALGGAVRSEPSGRGWCHVADLPPRLR